MSRVAFGWSLKHQFHGYRVKRSWHNGILCRKRKTHLKVLVSSKLTVTATVTECQDPAGQPPGCRREGSGGQDKSWWCHRHWHNAIIHLEDTGSCLSTKF